MAMEGIFYVEIQVADLARTKRFYGEALGWKLHTNEPNVAGLWFGTGYLVAVVDPDAATRPGPGGMSVAVRVDDLDAQYERLKGNGVTVNPIESRPWGQRDFAFTDPDGYRWTYAQPTG